MWLETQWSKYLKDSAIELLEPAGVFTDDGSLQSILRLEARSAAAAILPDDFWIDKMKRKIGKITRLIVSNSDAGKLLATDSIQIASSTCGSHYRPHFDTVGYTKVYTLD